jgi:hypothetical protein
MYYLGVISRGECENSLKQLRQIKGMSGKGAFASILDRTC